MDGFWLNCRFSTVRHILQVRTYKNFQFLNYHGHVSYPSKKKPRLIRTSSRWWVLLRKDYRWFLIKLSIIDFSSNITGPDLQKFSVFELSRSMLVIHQKRFLIKVSITREGLWMVSDRIVNFRFFVKFYRSGPTKIFSFWTIMDMLVIHQKRSQDWSGLHEDGEYYSGRIMDGFW